MSTKKPVITIPEPGQGGKALREMIAPTIPNLSENIDKLGQPLIVVPTETPSVEEKKSRPIYFQKLFSSKCGISLKREQSDSNLKVKGISYVIPTVTNTEDPNILRSVSSNLCVVEEELHDFVMRQDENSFSVNFFNNSRPVCLTFWDSDMKLVAIIPFNRRSVYEYIDMTEEAFNKDLDELTKLYAGGITYSHRFLVKFGGML